MTRHPVVRRLNIVDEMGKARTWAFGDCVHCTKEICAPMSTAISLDSWTHLKGDGSTQFECHPDGFRHHSARPDEWTLGKLIKLHLLAGSTIEIREDCLS